MGQTCKCCHKQSDSNTQTVTIEAQSLQKEQNINSDKSFQSTDYKDFHIKPNQFYLVISQDLCIYQQFLWEQFNSANETLRVRILNICWDIQFYLSTATNIFEYNRKDWQDFIESDERIYIVNCFVLNDQKQEQAVRQKLSSEPVFDFEKWLKIKKIKILKQSIHSKCLEQQ